MTATVTHRHSTPHPNWTVIIAATLIAAAAIVTFQYVSANDTTSNRPVAALSTNQAADTTGLGKALSVTYDTNTGVAADTTGLGKALSVDWTQRSVAADTSGLGQALSVTYPTSPRWVDTSGISQAFSIELPRS